MLFVLVGVSAGVYFMVSSSSKTDSETDGPKPGTIAHALAAAAEESQLNPAPAPEPEPEPKPQDNGGDQAKAQTKPDSDPLVCSKGTTNVNGVCVPEVRYLSGFDYADCDQKYTWSPDLKAYVNDGKDRALLVNENEVSCRAVVDGKLDKGGFGTRVLDVEVIFGKHNATDIPEGTERTMSGFRYANCDGHYRWSVALQAFVNDEHNRVLIMDGTRLKCHKLEDGKIAKGGLGSRVIGADGVTWN